MSRVVDVQKTLPHTGMALVLDGAHIDGPKQVTGKFLVRANDPRIMGHFGIMPGVLVAEFAHQTAAVLILQDEPDSLPCLTNTAIALTAAALPGDALACVVTEESREGRKASFSAVVLKINDAVCGQEVIATVTFTGTLLSKRILDRMLRKTGEALQATRKDTDATVFHS